MKSAKKPFCYLIFTAALFFFSIQNNQGLLSAFSRKSAYIDVYFYKTQHGSELRNEGQREATTESIYTYFVWQL